MLLYACELHAACVQKEGSAEEIAKSNDISRAVEQARLGDFKADEARNKAMDLMGKQVEVTAEVFKKAAGEFPDG